MCFTTETQLFYDGHMALEEIRQEREKKLRILTEKGIEPYPAECGRTHLIGDVLSKFAALAKSAKNITLAGRVLARREHGGSSFIDLADGSGKIQIYLKKDVLGDAYDLFLETIDIGDFIETDGKLFKTKKEEKTLEAAGWKILAKALLPLPEKWHGLQDVEERFRKRYLDLLMNEDVKERFRIRSQVITEIREFLDKRDFLEVETPLLHPIAGGALAKPFSTRYNTLDMDVYLSIAPELYLKRLLVGGFDRVYEIGRSFRNEGIDATHNPEFTTMECYAAYWSENEMMGLVEDLFLCLSDIFKKNSEEAAGDGDDKEKNKKIIFKKPFARIPFKEILKRYAQIMDYDKETRDTLSTRARQLGIESETHETKGKIADEIYKKICRPHIIQPTFIVNHPLDISPLAKKNSENKNEVRRFQLIIAGIELTNAYSELNDPQDQRERFEKQEKERTGGQEEAHRIDENFIEALEYGMPPAAGLGIGIDRLVMFLTGTKNIREVILFPTLRPKI